MDNKSYKKELFYMALFAVSYIGIYLAIFFWQMAGLSFVCRRISFGFRKGIIILMIVELIFYYFRTGFSTPIDRITVSGIVAAGISSAIMGGGSGEWILEPKFLIDLGIVTFSVFLVMLAVFFHEKSLYRGEIDEMEEKNADPDDSGENDGK